LHKSKNKVAGEMDFGHWRQVFGKGIFTSKQDLAG